MSSIKKKFLMSGIETQIRLGIMGVSLCITILVFTLLGIYSFVILNISYVDTITYFEEVENGKISNIMRFASIQLAYQDEIARIQMQILRNILNYSTNFQFILQQSKIQSNFKQYDPKRTGLLSSPCPEGDYHCVTIVYQAHSDTSFQYLDQLIAQMAQLIPVLDVNEHLRVIGLDNNPYIQNYTFHFAKENVTFYFLPYGMYEDIPTYYSSIENSVSLYNNKNYEIFMKMNASINRGNEYLKLWNENHIRNRTCYQLSERNPNLMYLSIRENHTDVSVSIKYQTGENSQNDVDSIIFGEIAINSMSSFAQMILKTFQDTTVIITQYDENSDQEVVITPFHCAYFKKLYHIGINNQSYQLEVPSNPVLEDCFEWDIAKEKAKSLLTAKGTDDKFWMLNNFQKKTKFPVMYYKEYGPDLVINYKIFKNHFPDYLTLATFQPNYIIYNEFFFYTFLTTKSGEYEIRLLYFRYMAIMFSILIVNTLIWLLNLIIIYCIVVRVSKQITTPINKLREYVENMNKIQQQGNYIKLIDQLKYEDDDTINELFTTCKELLKGGFIRRNTLQSDDVKLHIQKSVPVVCAVKRNNIMINEEQIEKENQENLKNLFKYHSQYIIPKEYTGKVKYYGFIDDDDDLIGPSACYVTRKQEDADSNSTKDSKGCTSEFDMKYKKNEIGFLKSLPKSQNSLILENELVFLVREHLCTKEQTRNILYNKFSIPGSKFLHSNMNEIRK